MQSNSLSWQSQNDIKIVQNALQQGDVVVGSSDTIFGLYANATKQGLHNLNDIKQREEKPYVILVESLEKLSLFVRIPDVPAVNNLITQCWPGPVTLILPRNTTSAAANFYTRDTIALRIPDHKGLLTLLESFNGIFSTSANTSGKPAALSVDTVEQTILQQVRYCIDGQSPHVKPSTILDCTQSEIIVVRAGAYPIHKLEQQAGVSFQQRTK